MPSNGSRVCNSSLRNADALARRARGLSYRPGMIRRFHTLLLLCVWTLLAGAAQARDDVIVFAPASLKNVLDAALSLYQMQSGTPVAVSYAGSSALARQIQHGAPADIFISANDDWMDVLEQDGLVIPDSRRVLAGNRLVLIGAQPGEIALSADALRDRLGDDGRLAMALVNAVPAGIYAKAALDHLGLWDALSPFVAQTDNVRAALRLVSLGEAQLGIVYATDARIAQDVHILARFDPDTHPPIRYPAARVADSPNPNADAVLDFLSGPDAQAVFAAHGFQPGDAP